MSKQKKSRLELEEETPDAVQDALDQAALDKELQNQEEAGEWLSEFQGRFSEQSVKVSIEKYEEGEWTICKKYPLAGFNPEGVRDEFGGGRYRATLFDPKGKYIKEGRHEFRFATPIKVAEEKGPERINPLQDPIVVMMLQTQKENTAMMVELMKSLVSGNAQQPKGNDLMTVVEAMKVMGALTPKDSGMKNMQETISFLATAKDLFGGEGKGEKEGGIFSDIKEFLGVWPEIKESLPQLKSQAPAPVTTIIENPTGRTKDMPKDPLSQKIIAVIPTFLKAAQANAPIDQWSDYLGDVIEKEIMPILVPMMKEKYKFMPVEITEDTVYDGLIKRAKDPAEREIVFKQIPPLEPYREWVNKVIDETIKQFEADEAEQAALPAEEVVQG